MVRRRRGVIAVLFLIVVAFIFGAISLSMNLGQIVERRIQADHATSAASFAYASKSAQGLNFISANNLAIAGASHMAGAWHVAADWMTLISTLWNADEICAFPQPFESKHMQDQYDFFYEMFRIATKLYFKSAVGLTRLNDVIKSTFPYLAMADAVTTGGANIPGSVYVPFSVRDTKAPATSGAGAQSISKRIKDALSGALSSFTPRYDGLRKINSDETFCLAYAAGAAANDSTPDNYHDLSKWSQTNNNLTDTLFGWPAEVLGKIQKLTKRTFSINLFGKKLSKTIDLLGPLGLRSGFAGCGFGPAGAGLSGGPSQSNDYELVRQILDGVLRLTLSGRDNKSLGTSSAPARPFGGYAPALEVNLNNVLAQSCNRSSDVNFGSWKVEKGATPMNPVRLDTVPSVNDGVCILPPEGAYRSYEVMAGGSNIFQKGVAGGTGPVHLNSYATNPQKIVCAGTYLFKWETWAGPTFGSVSNPSSTSENGEDRFVAVPNPSPGTHPNVEATSLDEPICPGFQANEKNDSNKIWFPTKNSSVSAAVTHDPIIGLDRNDNVFIRPILERLAANQIFQELEALHNPPIRVDAYAKISEYVACAYDHTKCPVDDANGGRFESQEVDATGNPKGPVYTFRPSPISYNFLCAIGSAEVPGDIVLRKLLKFDPRDFKTDWNGNYKKIQEWHNERVENFVSGMNCAAYEQYAKHPPRTPSESSSSSSGTSNDYCAPGADYCWQKGMQKSSDLGIEKLQKGALSFLIPEFSSLPVGSATTLELSLHFGIFSIIPLRTDAPGLIKGRNDGTDLTHCPKDMDVTVTIEGGATKKVCDIKPVIGMVSQALVGGNVLTGDTQFGGAVGADMNLASGGAIGGLSGLMFGQAGFLSVSQSVAKFNDGAIGGPTPPAAPVTSSKVYQMFWPSWYPAMEPSRLMSRIMPPSLAPLMED